MKNKVMAFLLVIVMVSGFIAMPKIASANPPVWTYQTFEDHTDPQSHCIILVTKTWGVDWLGQVTLMSTTFDYSGCNNCGCN